MSNTILFDYFLRFEMSQNNTPIYFRVKNIYFIQKKDKLI